MTEQPEQAKEKEKVEASAIHLLTPLPGRVVLRRTEPPAAPSPFIVPDAAKEKPVEAIVIAIPAIPTYEYGILIPCPLSVNDLVLVGKYTGDHKFRGEDVCIVRWDEILAIISPEV
jgi:chaperonin GroES